MALDVFLIVKFSPEPLLLHVTMVNRSGESFTMYRHTLPWAGFYSTLLMAVRTDAQGTALEKNSLIDDPGPDTIVVAPEEAIKGTIALDDRFPTLSDSLRTSDVLVFWSYQCIAVDNRKSNRTGGFVLIPSMHVNEA